MNLLTDRIANYEERDPPSQAFLVEALLTGNAGKSFLQRFYRLRAHAVAGSFAV
jgi:hypothetical protein